MSQNAPLNRAAIRFALLSLGILGLVTAVSLYFLASSSKKEPVVQQQAAAPVENKVTVTVKEETTSDGDKKTIVEEHMGTEATVISVEETAPKQGAPSVVPVAPRLASRPRQSHPAPRAFEVVPRPKRVAHSTATKFPAPSGLDLMSPASEVEMWSGTRKKVVFVPHGPSYD